MSQIQQGLAALTTDEVDRQCAICHTNLPTPNGNDDDDENSQTVCCKKFFHLRCYLSYVKTQFDYVDFTSEVQCCWCKQATVFPVSRAGSKNASAERR